MLNVGDVIQIENFDFRIVKFVGDRAGLAYTDKDNVTHIRWVNRLQLIELITGVAL